VITLTTEGPVATALLDRPEKLNAMPASFWGELRSVLLHVEEDASVRVLVFRGAGSCFSVGGDIEGFGGIPGPADRRAYVEEALSAFRAVEALPKPTIAAVHGHALGGGCELTLVCDIVVADITARFGMPETQVGLVPGLGVVRGLAQLNQHWMKHLVLTGESLSAEEAKVAGLVTRVTEAGAHVAEAERLAALIAKRAPLALAVAKTTIGRHAAEGYDHAINAVAFLQGTADHAEGIAAFSERRAPTFEGR
jgi:enoyl-CoA hydratase/carnithine racemase